MARYQKGSIGNNWEKFEDGPSEPRQPRKKPVTLLKVRCLGANGEDLRTFMYAEKFHETAMLAFRMNSAAMYDNPALLPEGTEQVSLLRGDIVIETRYRDRDELRLAS